MAKLIVVNREQLEASHRKLEELIADDPHWKEEQDQIDRYEAEEKKRRDAEYAEKQVRGKDSNEEAE